MSRHSLADPPSHLVLRDFPSGWGVYDPFLGSGTTLIAAERHARACYRFEIDPLYCDVIVARWKRFSGRVGGAASA